MKGFIWKWICPWAQLLLPPCVNISFYFIDIIPPATDDPLLGLHFMKLPDRSDASARRRWAAFLGPVVPRIDWPCWRPRHNYFPIWSRRRMRRASVLITGDYNYTSTISDCLTLLRRWWMWTATTATTSEILRSIEEGLLRCPQQAAQRGSCDWKKTSQEATQVSL